MTILPYGVNAQGSTIIDGKVYEFNEHNGYLYQYESESNRESYGAFALLGDLETSDMVGDIPAFTVNQGQVSLRYAYTDQLLKAKEDEWHFVEDNAKKISQTNLKSKIKKGAIILQTSQDGEKWIDLFEKTNIFEEKPNENDPFYTTTAIQLSNGCYYRVIVAYKIGRNKGEKVGLFHRDAYEYKKVAEVYDFYLHDSQQTEKTNEKMMTMGSVVNAGKGNGYSEEKTIGIDDPHYGWTLGKFFISGYTRDTKTNDGKQVFLKNVGDEITLSFNLEQDIDCLNGDDTLSIAKDEDGHDQFFGIPKMDMGRGMVIIRYTDEKRIQYDPIIYTNYLEANARKGANTTVKMFEEGDYAVALDYKIKKQSKVIGDIGTIPGYTYYRIFFEFSVRNGNCMVFPFDIQTRNELSNEALTANGFYLDMARSRYLEINVERAVITQGANGYVEDVRFDRPAKDGDSYTDDGIYTFTVKNQYTGEQTVKKIYVGESLELLALSSNGIDVNELNSRLLEGGIIENDGTITMPMEEEPDTVEETPLPEENKPEPTQTIEPTPTVEPTPVPSDSHSTKSFPLGLGGGIAVVCVGVVILIMKLKG